MLNRFIACAAIALASAAPMACAAEPYPTHPLRIIVPFLPGGSMDSAVRPLAQELSASLGQPVIVENRPGAGTVIGVDAAAKSAPDGYTLVCVANSFTANATLVSKLPYDTLKDLRGVAMLVRTPQALVGRTSLQAKDFRALVALARSEPGRLSYGTPGNGTVQHLGFEVLKRAASIDVVHVPYKGGNQALMDVMSGNLDLAFVNLTTALPQIRAGTVRSYGVASLARSALAPDMPTIAEQGQPGYESVAWFALMLPARVPDPIVQQVNAAVVGALGSARLRAVLTDAGFEPNPTSADALDATVRSEVAHYARVIDAAKIKAD